MNHRGTTWQTKALPMSLALAATATSVCLSVFAGWQRGGLQTERVLLICISVVLVVATHLLPALCRPHGWRIRGYGAALWIGCMVATCYGHAVFFVTAQQHAGEVRAAVVPAVSAAGRNLAAIANDRAGVVTRLAHVAERKCSKKCADVRIERLTLTARLAALDVESIEGMRRHRALERSDAERIAAKADPVAGLLTVFGVAASRVDLVAGMAFAIVLEGVACFCWLLARPPAEARAGAVEPAQEVSHGLRVTPVTPITKSLPPVGNNPQCPEVAVSSPPSEQGNDVTRVLKAVSDGTVRGTVAEIRKYLGCSQAKAAAVRKQLAQSTHSAVEVLAANQSA